MLQRALDAHHQVSSRYKKFAALILIPPFLAVETLTLHRAEPALPCPEVEDCQQRLSQLTSADEEEPMDLENEAKDYGNEFDEMAEEDEIEEAKQSSLKQLAEAYKRYLDNSQPNQPPKELIDDLPLRTSNPEEAFSIGQAVDEATRRLLFEDLEFLDSQDEF